VTHYDDTAEYRRTFDRHYRLGMHGGWTQGAIWTKRLLIILGSIWLSALLLPRLFPPIEPLFAAMYLAPAGLLSGQIWQLVTAPFFGVISPCQWWVFLFHLFYLLVFGPKVEREWGNKRFIRYYLTVAFLANFLSFLMRIPTPLAGIPASTVGAAVFAVMIAYGTMWPRDPFWVFGIFPAPVIYIILFLCAMEVLFMVLTPASLFGADYVASAMGVAIGFASMKIPAVKALILGTKRPKVVTTTKRVRSQEYINPPSASKPQEPKDGKKNKRSGYLEM
jgi:membrane associated rhomboid family serine protease